MTRLPTRVSPTTMGRDSVVVFWLPGGPDSSPSTPRITYSFGPFFFAPRTRRLPTFCGFVEACTSSASSAMETSLTPSCRSFCAYAFNTTCGSPSPAGCSWKTSMAVDRSSVYSRSWERSFLSL